MKQLTIPPTEVHMVLESHILEFQPPRQNLTRDLLYAMTLEKIFTIRFGDISSN